MGNQFPDLNREIMAKTKISDSVFTNLFKDPEYTIQLYRALHPEDTTSTKEDVTIVTLENVLLNQPYNDLGFIVGDKLMIFVEAQSTWSDNIVVRSLLYMSQTIQEYIMQSDQYIYGTKRVRFPKPEMYVLFTGDRKTRPDKLKLSEVFFDGESCDIDVTVHMLYDGKQGDIINQYVTFLKVCFEQFKIYGKNQKAVLEAIRICKDENILKEYLMSREKEVVNIMMMLFDQEYIFNGFIKEQSEIAREEALLVREPACQYACKSNSAPKRTG